MKRLVLGIVGLVILTGCGSSPQVEVKSDYMNCIYEQLEIARSRSWQSDKEKNGYIMRICQKYYRP